VLNRVTIENFRCLQHVDVDLRPLTVLIGPNDSGKSAFLAALEQLIGRNRAPNEADVWRMERNAVAHIAVKTRAGVFGRRGSLAGKWTLDGTMPAAARPITYFQVPSHGIPAISTGYSDEGTPPDLTADGGQIPSLIDFLLRRDRARFDNFVQAACQLVPGLQNVHVATPKPDQRRLDIVIEEGLTLPVDQASAGVQLILFFLALAYHPTPPRTILLEEPENGVHPKRLQQIMELLRGLIKRKHGNYPAQVILTTHSPHLLDHVDLDEDQVLVFRRKPDGSCTAAPVDKDRLKEFLDEFMLGEVWFNEEEDGLVGREK
jgi:predicted ATPase